MVLRQMQSSYIKGILCKRMSCLQQLRNKQMNIFIDKSKIRKRMSRDIYQELTSLGFFSIMDMTRIALRVAVDRGSFFCFSRRGV